VSTGALIAPFAFLGSEYDRTLAEIYTSDVVGDVVQMQFLPAGLFGSGILQPEPLRRLVEKYADERLLVAIAGEHTKGRHLLVVTTNMDAQRAVVWDMGKIAASGRFEALKLFRDILVASASVPAIFPPVLIDVQAGGKHFQEMHADGGPSTQVFTIPEGVLSAASSRLLPKGTQADLYVVINNALFPEFKVTSNNTFAIGVRGLDTMIKSQTRGSLDATYAFTKRAGGSVQCFGPIQRRLCAHLVQARLRPGHIRPGLENSPGLHEQGDLAVCFSNRPLMGSSAFRLSTSQR